ncbi:MAG TPA: DUF4783 domain-containing protein [Ferruginibacter sp.]|nr:DUF4783 domain-containing protein [Ferruginibacter sp.]
MKKFFTILLASIALVSFRASTGIEDVIAALKSGNAAQIANYFDNTVDITLPQKSNSYSKSQAEVILRDFFNNNPVKSFQVIHKGDNAGSEYCIGKMVTKNGTYRTTLFMKQRGDKQFLQELRLENE